MGAWSRSRAVLTATAAAAVVGGSVVLAACGGGGDDDDSAPQAGATARVTTLARQAFGPNPRATSGRIDGRIEITLKGARGYEEPVRLAMSGPFRSRAGSALPDYAVDLSVGNQGIGLSSAGGRSFASLGDAGYALPREVRRRLARSAAKGRNGLTRMLEQFGIAPWRWETNKRIAGSERIDGVQTVRVATGVAVDRFLRDANTLGGVLGAIGVARANGLPARIPRAARAVLVDSVRSANGASWIATSDKVMRKAGLTIDFVIPRGRRAALSGISAVKVKAEVLVSEVGRPQTIGAPRTLAPFSSLKLAFDALAEKAAR
ncbi:MAG TPA: hypothetical protein VGV67_10805 [Solirubrobacteraceae bacterium]|nr:hypothetical protein [Solirubrobacteraceae bacterium]